MADAPQFVLGIDLGGTGARAVLEPVGPRDTAPDAGPDAVRPDERLMVTGDRPIVGGAGSSVPDLAVELVARVRAARPDVAIAAVAVGATGVASLVDDHDVVLTRLRRAAGGAPVALAADAVTAHLGALHGGAGAVVAIGTGAIALGTDLDRVWRRVGGWGHLWDDRGSGAWIGIAALRAAVAAYDGVPHPGRADAAALLDAAVARFGPPPEWPARILPRPDRAGIVAEFAADVAALAESGDAAASALLREAGTEAARTLAAALDPALPARASATGGVLASPHFADALDAEFTRLHPDALLQQPAGTPLDGAVRLARLVAHREEPHTRPPYVWTSRGRARSLAHESGGALDGLVVRRPTVADHARVVGVIPSWWELPGTEQLGLLLPRLFFQHFADTSTVVDDASGDLAAFLVGFRSSAQPGVAYIHFVGVRPDLRSRGVARALYERFFAEMRASGCRRVDAITGPGNRRSQDFHRAMGFTQHGDLEVDGVAAVLDYDGPGEHRVTFTREL